MACVAENLSRTFPKNVFLIKTICQHYFRLILFLLFLIKSGCYDPERQPGPSRQHRRGGGERGEQVR